MTDEPHTDQSGEARELSFLRKARALLVRSAAHDAAFLQDEDGEARARKIQGIVIALTRITEMEDRYEGRIAERCADPDARDLILKRLRRDAARLVELPEAEFAAELRAIEDDAARQCAGSRESLSGNRGVPVAGARP